MVHMLRKSSSASALAIVCALAATVGAAAAQDLSALAFMSGHWVQKNEREDVQESWLGPRGNVMVATNLTLTSGRAASFEFLRIASKDGAIVYFASPGGRAPVEFPAKEVVANERIVFENPANAYPTRIIYRKDGDALVARIEGRRGGVDASEEWRFTKAR
jgi:hypothetical protein